ncbi:MAG TPA: outer membrane protein assembly factor BamD [Saprospiraceae bacterium]|nr:outer membrane protein assembly factor BamD [Saprospiraceae bacterium]HRO09128.1 outer membrane protein assembly factor BamD [Saprospiraceae bacterium]HRP42458.1 outer membrane protein assembly factor BamD [Saprospiraceae bacterium]
MRIYIGLVIVLAFILSGCKSEFETLRASNQPEKVYAAANKYYKNKEYDKAIALYDVVIQFYRGRQEAEDLFFNYAYAHYYQGDYILSATYFKNYSGTFGNSPNKQEAEYMAAYSNYKMSPNFKLDQSYTVKAIEGMEQFINLYPGTERAEMANRLIDEMRRKLEQKSYEQGTLYYKIGQYQAAVISFQNTIKDFPESAKIEEIRFLILKSSYILASNSIYEKQEERFNETLDHYNVFIKKHPASKMLKEAKNIEKQTLAELKKLKA